MNDTQGTNKPEYDKIALLGLFIAALLVAHLIVVIRSRISFSDPIRLSQTGLSVSIPVGRAWQSDIQWQYQDNVFTLSSLFPRGSDRPTTWANCRYLLSAETIPPQVRFEEMASGIDAVIAETNQTQVDTLTIYWARIDKTEVHFSMFFGTANLPDNRQLEIEVSQIAGDGELAETVFKHIIETLKFEDNRLLKTGAEIIPAHIAAIEVARDLTASENAAYAFMPELPDGRGFSENIHLNDQKEIYHSHCRQDNIYSRTSRTYFAQ